MCLGGREVAAEEEQPEEPFFPVSPDSLQIHMAVLPSLMAEELSHPSFGLNHAARLATCLLFRGAQCSGGFEDDTDSTGGPHSAGAVRPGLLRDGAEPSLPDLCVWLGCVCS